MCNIILQHISKINNAKYNYFISNITYKYFVSNIKYKYFISNIKSKSEIEVKFYFINLQNYLTLI